MTLSASYHGYSPENPPRLEENLPDTCPTHARSKLAELFVPWMNRLCKTQAKRDLDR